MIRYTTEQVDLALLCAEVKTGEQVAHVAAEDFYRMPDVLAAEVRALREEARLFSDAHEAAELRIVELRATIARVEALRDDIAYATSGYWDRDALVHAFEKALRGKS